ncbi:MAG: DUF4383 domain-containing protein [Candidatus Moranbacteria bacterium]|jgi:hypothetical protein|nr:DUF4383 domain-containing protein [Candidatus Moranbacteria bacterium]MBP9801949.1 DUF4383 domain-containing protein [Candidatus Moranbacteria bacterium]
MQKILLLALASGFVGVGLFGFTCGSLPGTFDIDPLHNITHILSGLLAFAAVMLGERMIRFYARSFGVIYLIVSVIGFFEPTRFVCGLFVLNTSDYWLYIGVSLLLLWIGFFRYPKKDSSV